MQPLEDRVADHYTTEDLLARIRDALRAAGADLEALRPADLKPVDEFHTGGLKATEALLSQVEISDTTRVLDVGCGLGGTARWLVERHGCPVTGIDLTPDYVEVARRLTDLVGLDARFEVASALELPFDDAAFDVVTMFHVGMNIEDKQRLFSEVARVLAPDGRFALFDVMRSGEGELTFPFPWSETPEASFVERPEAYRDAARAAGLEAHAERERRQFALDFFAEVFAGIERGEASPLGIHLLMKETGGAKIQNYVECCRGGAIAPVEMIFRA